MKIKPSDSGIISQVRRNTEAPASEAPKKLASSKLLALAKYTR